ncbi:hypothetical protein GEV43_10815 [Actinomadura sp. J1-007]|uniref:hypothetical protein n=1 Tax=Actinomadura sp. J1-007 TaxID=2661913 RepID=UPI0013242B9C|nr:hypothetical protein [Actinomadura sp. J1-007]MWK34485.1 hypothetical protein [Actinomadura sp. J1-007]
MPVADAHLPDGLVALAEMARHQLRQRRAVLLGAPPVQVAELLAERRDAVEQGEDRVGRGVEQVRVARRRDRGGAGGGVREQLAEVADHVVPGRTDRLDHLVGALARPLPAVGRQRDAAGRAHARQHLQREDVGDEPVVEPHGRVRVDGAVDAPQQLGLGPAQRRVGARLGQVGDGGVHADQPGEPLPEQLARSARPRHREHVHPFRRDVRRPAREHLRDVVHPPEPGGGRVVARPVDHLAEPVLEVVVEAVLDVLLPLRGQQPGEVAGGVDHVHLGGGERGHGAFGLLGGRRGDDLVGDHGDAGVGRLDLCDELVPAALPVGGGVVRFRTQPAQVAGRAHVRGERAAGHEHAVLGEDRGVVPQQALDEGRAALRSADVQVDDRRGACWNRGHLGGLLFGSRTGVVLAAAAPGGTRGPGRRPAGWAGSDPNEATAPVS